MLLSLVASCKRDLKKEMEAPISKYFAYYMGDSLKLDSLTIFKIDTATERTKLEYKAESLARELRVANAEVDLLMADTKLKILYARQWPTDQMFFDAAKDKKEELDKYMNEVWRPLVRQSEVNDSLIQACDTVKYLAYLAHGIATYTKPSGAQASDTFRVLLSKDLKVIEPADFIK